MARKFKTMYWSSFEMYINCPQRFLWKRGWEGIDLGYGMGEPIPPPKQDSMHHAVMGIALAKGMEDLYNLTLWRNPPSLREKLENIVAKELQYQIARKYIDWGKTSHEEMLKVCLDGIRGYLSTMKHNKLLGEYARSEVDMVADLGEGFPIGGRADLVIKRGSEVGIYDGKNSKSKGKYTSPDQLRWYGLLYHACEGVLPDKLGFIYFRYPFGTPTADGNGIEQGVDYISCNEIDIQVLSERAVQAWKDIRAKKFEPTPTPKYCNFCEYNGMCDARQEQRKANAKKRKKSLGLELDAGTEPFFEFSLPRANKK